MYLCLLNAQAGGLMRTLLHQQIAGRFFHALQQCSGSPWELAALGNSGLSWPHGRLPN